MRSVLLVFAAILTVASTVPYVLDIIKRKTKPRIVSWFNWTLLTGIAAAASFSAHQYPSAVLTSAACIETAVIVILGLHYGDRKFETFDVICEIGAILGLILWIIFNNPLIAIVATVSIDFIASLPTLRHSWQRPGEETLVCFILAAIGAIFTILALHQPHISGIIYPIYILFINVFISTILIMRTGKKKH